MTDDQSIERANEISKKILGVLKMIEEDVKILGKFSENIQRQLDLLSQRMKDLERRNS